MQALYGLNITGSTFRNHLADFMHSLVFLLCTVDLYIWMKPMLRPDGEFNYYSYVLIYVDDVMVIHHYAYSVLRRMDKYFNRKPSSIGDPDIHLRDNLHKMRLENGVWAWANIPERCVN